MDVFTKQELLEIRSRLNGYDWDYRLGSKPLNFDEMPDYSADTHLNKYNVIKPYMKILESVLDKKEILRYHHINNLSSDRKSFELWWFKRKIRMFITGDPF